MEVKDEDARRSKNDESDENKASDEKGPEDVPNEGEGAGEDLGTVAKIILPDSLEGLPRAEQLPSQRHRWNTNEEIAAILINFDRHGDWLSREVRIRPKSGSMLLYSRKKVRYRRDGYCWKKRKDGKTTREDHMKLKVQGTECIYGCYVHSAILPTFHRRCYWLLQNPDIVLVHYLNVPYPDDSKLVVVASVALWGEHKEWTKDELVAQLRPMFFSEEEPDRHNELEVSTAETVESIVNQLLEKQRAARSGSVTSSVIANQQTQIKARDPVSADSTWSAEERKQVSKRGSTANFQPKVEQRGRSGHENSETQVSSTTGPRSLHHRAIKQHSELHQTQTVFTDGSSQSAQFFLNLSQLQSGTGLLIFNGNNASGGENRQPSPKDFELQAHVSAEPSKKQCDRQKGGNDDGTKPQSMQHHDNVKIENDQSRINESSQYQGCASEEKSSYQRGFDSIMSPMKTEEYDTLANLTAEDVQRTLNSTDKGDFSFSPLANFMGADDMLVNIDPLDVLSDFDIDSVNCDLRRTDGRFEVGKANENFADNSTVYVTDYSPEWAPTEGGCKVLVAGPWLKTDSAYAILIDGQTLPTTVVQPGVLRCHCQPHLPGTVSLQVSCDSEVISNTLTFEYREVHVSPCPSSLDLLRPTATIHHHPDVLISRSPTKTPENPTPTGNLHDCLRSPNVSNGPSPRSNFASPEPGKFFKRSSLDSVTVSQAQQPSLGDSWKRPFDNRVPKLSRHDRSLSLPVSSLPPSPSPNLSVPSSHLGVRAGSPKDPDRYVHGLDPSAYGSQFGPPNRRESVSSCDLNLVQLAGEQDSRVLTLAEQIIAAMPDRIKMEMDEMSNDSGCNMMESSQPILDLVSRSSYSEPAGNDSMDDSVLFEPLDFSFEFSDHSYRYCDPGTPSSSLSPGSSSCLQSPCSYSMDSPSPPPTTADFTEFFQASNSLFVNDFSNLMLSDREQRDLYEAAKVIQKAYRSYKGRKKAEEQDREKQAAVLIQNYYRRYKQYVYIRQMNRAALVIQNQFRSYYETKRFKKQEGELCPPPQSHPYYRQCRDVNMMGRQSREGTPNSAGLKRTYSQRRQHQAARKIQQFMRQSKNKLQRERALAAQQEKPPEGAFSSPHPLGIPSTAKR